VVFINSFLYEILTDDNFKVALGLWFENKEEWRFGHISYWNTTRVTDMSGAFQFKNNFNDDISRWNVTNVTDMGTMFFGATNFNGDLAHWDVSNVTNMSHMFYLATQFNGNLACGMWRMSPR
jgi:surface protein